MTDQRDKTSNGTQNPIPRTATAGELLAVKESYNIKAQIVDTILNIENLSRNYSGIQN